jgi:hypothetical protein
MASLLNYLFKGKMRFIMNKSKINLSVLLLLFIYISIGTGCKKQLDINQNPNFPTLAQGKPFFVFPVGVLATTGKVGADLAIVGGMWSQYYTQNAFSSQYKQVDAYNMPNTDNFVNDTYNVLFTSGLKNYQYVIDQTRASGDWNTFLMATVMKAYTAAIMVDLYDSLPYAEALQGIANQAPHFEGGYDIYTSVLSEIDSALSMDFNAASNTNIGTQDLVFGGDISQWMLFANTLKLKLYLRMVNAHPDVAQAGIAAMTASGTQYLTTSAQVTNFKDALGLDNPFYEWNQRTLNTTSNLKASATFVLYLEGMGDTRIETYFATDAPTPIHQGDYSGSNAAYPGATTFYQTPTDPVQFISAAESYFLQAEAAVRWPGTGDPKALYEQGVLASFTEQGLDGSGYIAPGGVYEWGNEIENGVTLNSIQQIIRQKWIAFAYGCHQIEGFFDQNRTGFPLVSDVYSELPNNTNDPEYLDNHLGQLVYSANSTLAAGLLPRRFVYPYDETSTNPNAPQKVVPISTPVWWAIQ